MSAPTAHEEREARGYAEEYRAENPAGTEQLMFTDFYRRTDAEIRARWGAVVALAEALLDQDLLSKAAAFELIEANLSDTSRMPGPTA